MFLFPFSSLLFFPSQLETIAKPSPLGVLGEEGHSGGCARHERGTGQLCLPPLRSLAWGGEKSAVVVTDASCAPVKGGDAGGRFGFKTQAAKPPVWRGEALMEPPGVELPGSHCFGCPPVPNPVLGNTLALPGSAVLCVCAHFILYP